MIEQFFVFVSAVELYVIIVRGCAHTRADLAVGIASEEAVAYSGSEKHAYHVTSLPDGQFKMYSCQNGQLEIPSVIVAGADAHGILVFKLFQEVRTTPDEVEPALQVEYLRKNGGVVLESEINVSAYIQGCNRSCSRKVVLDSGSSNAQPHAVVAELCAGCAVGQ